MKIGKTIQCQSCGGSRVIKHAEKSLLECQYCGAMMTYTEGDSGRSSAKSQLKVSKSWVVLLTIATLGLVILFLVMTGYFSTRQPDAVIIPKSINPESVSKDIQPTELESTGNIQVLNNMKKDVQVKESINQRLSIQSEVRGETTTGGQYWIFGVKNISNTTMVRPGIMVSLFNPQGKRLAEQGGWSQKKQLEPGEESAVLVFLSEPPVEAVDKKITPLASEFSQFDVQEIQIKVLDYTVNTKNKQFEIIGDVKNNHDSRVKYVRVVAVAYNADGVPIGIGHAYSTEKQLAPNQGSGFKIRVGAFLTDEPDSWQLIALAREE